MEPYPFIFKVTAQEEVIILWNVERLLFDVMLDVGQPDTKSKVKITITIFSQQNLRSNKKVNLVQDLGQSNTKESLHIHFDFLLLLSIFCHCWVLTYIFDMYVLTFVSTPLSWWGSWLYSVLRFTLAVLNKIIFIPTINLIISD